jgi:hypothetical protein
MLQDGMWRRLCLEMELLLLFAGRSGSGGVRSDWAMGWWIVGKRVSYVSLAPKDDHDKSPWSSGFSVFRHTWPAAVSTYVAPMPSRQGSEMIHTTLQGWPLHAELATLHFGRRTWTVERPKHRLRILSRAGGEVVPHEFRSSSGALAAWMPRCQALRVDTEHPRGHRVGCFVFALL